MKTWTHWGILCNECDGEVFEYDDEADARAHLPNHPDGYVVRCEVTKTPWERAV